MKKPDNVPKGHKVIYCRFIRKNGKIIYPKGSKFFRFVVKA